MKKFQLLIIYLIGLTFQAYSHDFTSKFIDSTYSKSKFSYDYYFGQQGIQAGSSNIRKKEDVKPWGYFQGRGSIVNLGILGCVDSYGILGWGVDLAISSIRMNGLTGSFNIGGASNQIIWLGGGIGYTHGMHNLAPYGLVGGALTYSDEEGELLFTGSLEFGIHRSITDWFSVKAALRSSLGRNSYDYQYFNYNVLVLSMVIDLPRQIPYW
jgi:hypothetical protein